MTIADYAPFVDRMIGRYEGGYGWDKNDPGGPTKDGITCYDLAEFMHKPMTSMAAWAPIVAAMTLATADQIYAIKYATSCAFNALNVGKDCVVFDFGVNSGQSRSIKCAQIVVGFRGNDVDGVIGDKTLAAINGYDPVKFVNQLCDARMAFLEGLPIWHTFKAGWTARVIDLRAYSLTLIQTAGRSAAAPHTFTDKPERIPLAFAKAYALEDMPPRLREIT
jgi:lysozyme family protein